MTYDSSLLTVHILWQFSSNSSHPLTDHIHWQFIPSDSLHPLIIHILLIGQIVWQFTSSNSSHYLTVHILWEFIFHIFVPNPIIYDSLLYLLAYYPPPKYNNGKNNYVNIIFSFCTSYISYQSALRRSIQMYYRMINTNFNHVYLYDVSWKTQAFFNAISKIVSWSLLNMSKYGR